MPNYSPKLYLDLISPELLYKVYSNARMQGRNSKDAEAYITPKPTRKHYNVHLFG